jgi:hypothetical protein
MSFNPLIVILHLVVLGVCPWLDLARDCQLCAVECCAEACSDAPLSTLDDCEQSHPNHFGQLSDEQADSNHVTKSCRCQQHDRPEGRDFPHPCVCHSDWLIYAPVGNRPWLEPQPSPISLRVFAASISRPNAEQPSCLVKIWSPPTYSGREVRTRLASLLI